MTRVHQQVHVTDIEFLRETPLPDDVDRVVTVCQESVTSHIPEGVAYEWYQMSDGPACGYGGDHSYRLFEMAAASVLWALEMGQTVLIHCHMGQSRSVSVAAAAICVYEEHDDPMKYMYRIKDLRATGHLPDDSLIRYAKRFVNQRIHVSDDGEVTHITA